MRELENKIKELEAVIEEYMTGAAGTGAPAARDDSWHQAKKQEDNIKDDKAKDKNDDALKPMHPKDTKPPSEFGGARKDFMHWHAGFTSMLRLRSANWTKIADWLKSKREKRLTDGQAKADFMAYSLANGQDEYV